MRNIARFTLATLVTLSLGCGHGESSGTSASVEAVPRGEQFGSICEKYGGAPFVAAAVKGPVLRRIGADCRINAMFVKFSAAARVRIADCMSVYMQELFGCPGIAYAGSAASNGLACRNMIDAHKGWAISAGDFEALLQDFRDGFAEAGVAPDDVATIMAPLIAVRPEVIEEASTRESSPRCDGGT